MSWSDLPQWVWSNKFYKVEFPKGGGSSKDVLDDKRQLALPEDANVVSSVVAELDDRVVHSVMLDIDVPMKVIPSSTPGHHHLYFDINLFEEDYLRLIKELNRAGIVQQGIVGQMERNKCTTLRLPNIKKEKT